VTHFLCGLPYATIGLFSVRGRRGGYITTVTDITVFSFQVTVTKWRVQEGSTVESTRTRMELILNEL
jgi:hypothetical protein